MNIFEPAICLLNRLSYPKKFLLISVLFALPLVVVMYLFLGGVYEKVRFTERQLLGLTYLQPLRELWEALPERYFLHYGLLAGEVNEVGVVVQEAEVASVVRRVMRLYGEESGGLNSGSVHEDFLLKWRKLQVDLQGLEGGESPLRVYKPVIDSVYLYMHDVGNRSGLILDPYLDTYYLSSMLLVDVPEIQKQLFDLRLSLQAFLYPLSEGEGEVDLLRYDAYMQELQVRLLVISELLPEKMDDLLAQFAVVVEENKTGDLRLRVEPELLAFVAVIRKQCAELNQLLRGGVRVDSFVHLERVNKNLMLSFKLWDNLYELLSARLQGRVLVLRWYVLGVVGFAGLLVGVVVYLFVGFYLAVMRLVVQLDVAAQRMVGDDFHGDLVVDSRDELGQVVRAFNCIAEDLRCRKEELERANLQIMGLNSQLASENARMGMELDITRRLQELILPKSGELAQIVYLDIAGFMEPANEVGGDYYDVLQQDGQVMIGIGDITGHGLESGMLMIMLQTAVRTLFVHQVSDYVKFVQSLNSAIYHNIQRMNSSRNLTLLLLEYEYVGGEGVCGLLKMTGQHESVLVVRRSGVVELIDTIDLGFPIGLESNISDFIGQLAVELAVGDGVVLYTDGIVESENLRGEFYTVERLCTVVSGVWQRSAEEVRECVIADVRAHIGEQVVFDDITLLVIKQR